MVTDYQLLVASSAAELNEKVAEAIKDSFQPHASPSVVVDEKGATFIQAVIRDEYNTPPKGRVTDYPKKPFPSIGEPFPPIAPPKARAKK